MPKNEPKTERQKAIRFSVSLSPSLLNALDAKVAEQGYASRSEFTRDLIRAKQVKDEWEMDASEPLYGVLSVVYDSEQSKLLARKNAVIKKRAECVISSTCVHLGGDNFLEVLILRGLCQEISAFANDLAGLKGVKFSELSQVAVFDE